MSSAMALCALKRGRSKGSSISGIKRAAGMKDIFDPVPLLFYIYGSSSS